MRKMIIPLIVVTVFPMFLLFAQNSNDLPIRINMDNPSDYLPDYLDNIYIGMPFADFVNIKDTLFLDTITPDSVEWLGFRENVNDEIIASIVYKFDAVPDSLNDQKPLYQINVTFTDQEKTNDFVTQRFGDPTIQNEDSISQWILRTNKNFVLIVKQRNLAVKLIATIAGTDWDPNER